MQHQLDARGSWSPARASVDTFVRVGGLEKDHVWSTRFFANTDCVTIKWYMMLHVVQLNSVANLVERSGRSDWTFQIKLATLHNIS